MKLKSKILVIFLMACILYFFIPKVIVFATENVSNIISADMYDYENDDGGASSMAKLSMAIRLFQLVLSFGGILLLIVSLIKYWKKRAEIKRKLSQLDENAGENHLSQDAEKLLMEKKKSTAKFIVCIVIAILMFLVVEMIEQMQNFNVMAKPIVYLYPEEQQQVSVTLGRPDKLTCVYPAYDGSWEVAAAPNGDLVDLKTNRKLYALYWEGKNDVPSPKITEGFCVKGEEAAAFLEDKLAILGLNEREAEEFIVYWLPKLEKNKYNLIRFETMEEIAENMPLEIQSQPDVVIRVMMEFKAARCYVDLPEQQLVTPERKGFVAVEWGGTEL